MKIINRYLVITILMTIVLILSTSNLSKVNATITGAPGVGYPESLRNQGNIKHWCCQENVALWSPNITTNYDIWYWKELPFGRREETLSKEVDGVVAKALKMSNGQTKKFIVNVKYINAINRYYKGQVTSKKKFELPNHTEWWDKQKKKKKLKVQQGVIVTKYNNATSVKLDSYKMVDSGYGDAAETYIANHYDGYFGGGEAGPGQRLWWKTAVGQSIVGGNSHVSNAKINEFEDYIEAATGDRNAKTSEDGFKIHYNPKWITDGIYENPKAIYIAKNNDEKAKFIIGPFAINYIYGGEFAHITNLNVYTDASNEPIKAKIVNCSDIKNDACPAPAPNTTFYLEIDVIPNATKITNVHFDFKYDNASMHYSRYDSPNGYKVVTMGLMSKEEYLIYHMYKKSNGKYMKGYPKYGKRKYTLYVTRLNEKTVDAQSLAETTQWWKTYTKELDRKESSHKATISVEKIIQGENGETLSLADLGLDENSCPSFDFEINVAGNSKEIISVKPGETKTSKVYEWKGSSPSFTVKELDNSSAIAKLRELGYEIGDIQLKEYTTSGGRWDQSKKEFSGRLPSEGNLITLANNQAPSTTIHLIATNKKKPDTGTLKIVKKFEDYKLPGVSTNNQVLLDALDAKANELKNNKFKFDVLIYGNFEYKEGNNWIKCTNESQGYKRTVDASANEPWVSPEIRWYGEPPRYKVTENLDSSGVTKIKSITPSSGTDLKTSEGQLAKGQTATVTALNEINVEKAKIKIIKKVDFTELLNNVTNTDKENLKNVYAEGVRNHTFKFELDVENYPSMKIDVPGTLGVWEEKDGKTYFVINKTIEQEFIWVKREDGLNGLRYELNEKADDKTDFVSATSNGLDITVTDKKVKGSLKPSGTDLVAEIENVFINKAIDPEYDIKAINLYKMISNQEDLKDKDYKFRITIEGKAFNYGNKAWATKDPKKNIKIQLTNATGEEPAFEIEHEKTDDTKVVTIHIKPEELIKHWTSEKISWCTFVDAPTYTIEEITTGTEVEESIVNGENRLDTALGKSDMIGKLQNIISEIERNNPKEGSTDATYKKLLQEIKDKIEGINDGEYNKHRSLFIIAKNMIDKTEPKIKEGKFGIIKKLENQGLLTENDIKELGFSFNVQVGNNVPYKVTLKYDEDEEKNNLYKINDTYYWIYVPKDRITWNEDEAAPKYIIEETDDYKNDVKTEFVDITATPEAMKDNKKIEGTISEELIKTEELEDFIKEDKLKDVTNLVTVTNKIEKNNDKKMGKLVIQKDVTNSSLIGKDFKFKVTITGKYNYPSEEGNEKIEKKEITVKGGQKETIENIVWYGENPTYLVEEIDNPYSEAEGNRTWSGTLNDITNGGASNAITIVATNKTEEVSGGILLTKTVVGGNVSGNEKYTFKVEIEGHEPYPVTIGPGETLDLGKFSWDPNKEAPTYKITETNIPPGSEFVSITGTNGTPNNSEHSVTGRLIPYSGDSNKVVVKCINSIGGKGGGDNKGKFRVQKKVASNPKGGVDLTNKTFTVNMVISGTFKIEALNISRINGTYTITKKLKKDEVYESPEIIWYGDNKPVVHVSEELDLDGADKGWRLLGISNNDVQLKEGNNTLITITNEIPEYAVIDLTLELAGTVWEDENKDLKGEEANADGIRQGTEKRVEGVKVYVYKKYTNGNRELATIYDNAEGAVINQPIITDKTGHWDAPRVKITDEGYLKDYSFDVEFVYDGQTYEPTKFLEIPDTKNQPYLSELKKYNKDYNRVYGEKNKELSESEKLQNIKDKADLYKNCNTKKRDYYQFSSMALDVDRNAVNNRISEVKGLTSIDGNGNTTGIAVDNNGKENYIYYKSKNAGTGNSRIVSEVQTLNSDKTALDLFKATARTSVGDLTYGFDKKMRISSVNYTLTGQGLETSIEAIATYNYCLNINLGLTKRQEVDIEAQKDLEEATIIVNDKKLTYSFNKLKFLNKDVVNITAFRDDIDSNNLTYTLGLYKTDYYYRAEMYKASENYEAIKNFYNRIYPNEGIDATNMEIYLKYKISLYNGSSVKYTTKINSIEDYYESSLKLVTGDVERYIESVNGNDINNGERMVVAKAPKFESNSFSSNIDFTPVEYNIKGSDGVTYNKLKTNLGITLNSGESGKITVYMKANVNSIEEVKNTIDYELRNNQKSNIVEISSYTVLNKDNQNKIEGKIDRNSAPSNIDIINRNEKSWYEGDTDEAPRLEIGLIENGKTVTGTVWEDSKNKYNYGVYDEGDEALIGGLTTQFVEKVKIQNQSNGNFTNNYTDYDFVWPTNVPLNGLNGRTIEEVSGFSSTVETSRVNSGNKHVGEYKFESVPTGNYIVRFLYGNNKLTLDDKSKNTGNPEALKSDGTSYLGNNNILTANYDNDKLGRTPAVYNGHDYQATAYKRGENGLIQNEWETNLNDDRRLSDARDSEPRRLEVIANSETITNVNGEVLNSANNIKASHDDLFDSYYMYADTAKLNLNYDHVVNDDLTIDGKADGKTTTKKYANKNSVKVNVDHTDYDITKIDFGLVERPENKVIIDKEISEIKLITNDGNTIFDGIYHTNYELVNSNDRDKYLVKLAKVGDKYLVAETVLDVDNSVGTDVLQALNKKETKWGEGDANTGTQNFRYINVEERILQGTTIELKYNIYALNASEEDYTSNILNTIDYDNEGKKRSSSEIKAELLRLAEKSYTDSYTSNNGEAIISSNNNGYQIGKYLGKYYYRHNTPDNDDKIVTTRVRQVVDYVDNDAVFTQEYNSTNNNSWKGATITELSGNGLSEDRLLGKDILAYFEILDKRDESYVTEKKSNIALSIDSLNNTTDSLNNNDFEKELIPCIIRGNKQELANYSSMIGLTVTKTVAAEDDANNLAYDNLAEIVKFENSVGRRNITAVPGNCNPKELNQEGDPIGEFGASIKEIDSSATELVTFIPPTGIETEDVMQNQIIITILAGLTIIAVGIVVIKKKILK